MTAVSDEDVYNKSTSPGTVVSILGPPASRRSSIDLLVCTVTVGRSDVGIKKTDLGLFQIKSQYILAHRSNLKSIRFVAF